MITFENVSKTYQDGTEAVRDLNLEIQKGEFFVFIGPSGCGKTTSLKMINRLIFLTEGTLYIDGQRISDYDINELRWNIGYVLQQIALFPHMTIEENIAIVPELKKWDAKTIGHRVDELLDMVGMTPETYKKRKPPELSGGEQQRIGVIRALAADPDVILMDEPFSALDPMSREKLQQDILDLQQRIHKTIVFVTHDMSEALALGDRICMMQDGQAVQVDTPRAIMRHPANAFVEDFVGSGVDTKHRLVPDRKDIAGDLVTAGPSGMKAVRDRTISAKLPLEDALPYLVNEDHMPVEKDGKVIGVLTRQALISHLAKQTTNQGGKGDS